MMTSPTRTPSPSRTRRLAASLGGVLLAAGLLAGCGGDATGNEAAVNDDGSVDLSQVTLIVGDQKSSAQKALLDAAGLEETEYDIEYKEFTSGPPMLQALDSGSLHVAYVGNTPPIFAAASGSEFKIVQASTYGGLGDAIVVPQDSPLQSVADLAGKKIAVAKGSSANYNLVAQLEAAGVDYADVEIQDLQPADALAAFSSGAIDAWVIWEPFTSQAELEAGARVLADGQDVVNGMNFQVASDVALDDPATEAALEDYLTRITEAQVWASENREEWAEIWAAQTGLSPDVTLAAAKKRPIQILSVDEGVIGSEQEIADAFADNGLLPEPVEVADYFSDQFDSALAPFIEQTAP